MQAGLQVRDEFPEYPCLIHPQTPEDGEDSHVQYRTIFVSPLKKNVSASHFEQVTSFHFEQGSLFHCKQVSSLHLDYFTLTFE